MRKSTLNRALSKSNRITQLSKENGATRFEAFQLRLLEIELPAHIHLFLSLFAFDGLRVGDLKKAMLSQPLRYEGVKIGLGWIDEDNRQQRIQLGSISLRLLSGTDWALVQKLPLTCLAEHYLDREAPELALQMFTRDQVAWVSEVASGPTVDHSQGIVPMTALSDDCYARLQTKQALAAEADVEDITLEGALYQSLEGWLEPQGKDKNPTVVNEISELFKRKNVDDQQGYKSRKLQQCLDKLSDAIEAGPLTSLILAWVIHLLLNGTKNRSNAAVNTIIGYVKVFVVPIFSALQSKDFERWELSTFEEVYDGLMANVMPTSQGTMASAIKSWHHFLVGWLDVPPLKKQYHDEVNLSIPLANVLWQHEYELIQTWLANASLDPRLGRCLKAMFNVAFRKRFRINELLKLRVGDAQILDNVVQVNIHGTKSIYSKRRIDLKIDQFPEFVELVRYRQDELASMGEYLFGDPNRIGKIYSLSKLYTCANHLLKSATGDVSIRFHTLAHTVVSSELIVPMVGGTSTLTNSLHQLSSDFGHYSILTSFSEYMHRYEGPIRETIDRGISNLKISYRVAERWSHKSSSALRKQASRSESDKQAVQWQSIFSFSCKVDVQDVSVNRKVSKPNPPTFLSSNATINLSNILNIFSDVQRELSLEIIALRQSLSVQDINDLLRIAKGILSDCSNSRVDFSFSTELVVRELQNTDWIWFAKAYFAKEKTIIKIAQKSFRSFSAGINAWLRLIENGYFSLEDQLRADQFLKLLAQLNIPKNQVAIAYTNACNRHYLKMLQACFFEYFHLTVPTFEVGQRGGRPYAYLLFSSQNILTNVMPKSATLSTSGLNAILFSIAVLREFDSER